MFGRHDLPPQILVLGPPLGRVPQDLQDLRAHVGHGRVGLVGGDVDERRDVFDERAVAGLRVAEALLALALIGDVQDHPLPEERRAVVGPDQARDVLHPEQVSVLVEDPVLPCRPVLLVQVRGPLLREEVLVVGVHHAHPQVGVVDPLLRPVPGELLGVGTHVQRRRTLLVGVDVDLRRNLFDQRPILRLGVGQGALGVVRPGEIGQHTEPQGRTAGRFGDDPGLVVNPPERAVRLDEPVLLVPVAAGRVHVGGVLPDALSVLGMQQLVASASVHHEGFWREPDHGLALRAHIQRRLVRVPEPQDVRDGRDGLDEPLEQVLGDRFRAGRRFAHRSKPASLRMRGSVDPVARPRH